MSTYRPDRARSRTGLTLIETLLALSILTLIAGVSFSVYRTVTGALAHQSRWRREWQPAADALDAVRRDLACACAPAAIADRAFVLDPGRDDGEDSSTLACYTASPPDDSTAPDRIVVARVTYAVRPAADSSGSDLVRESRALDDRGTPGPSREDRVARRVKRFSVSVSDGRQWTTKWVTGQGRGLPRAARVTIVFAESGQSQTLETSAYIPAGGGRPARAAW